ncbi:unnamed protein product [Eruca vesicaria subsp. sativa]|uniref:Uncharacterized protein n=1 Tax=Eruca vesicaria subsp. sativa TaxID=29727 RepID=A0ABC8IMI2_ERUVS|nr:unnamed protein product [Eruca vesicaria subsp. sativa]
MVGKPKNDAVRVKVTNPKSRAEDSFLPSFFPPSSHPKLSEAQLVLSRRRELYSLSLLLLDQHLLLEVANFAANLISWDFD